MTKMALMFSGQGAQYHGMGKDLFDRYEMVQSIYHQSEEVTGYPIKKISFEEDERLNQTQYTQVCMFTLYQAVLALLEEKNINVESSMGLSLGEYGAYLHQGVFDFKTGLQIIKKRGELMAVANKDAPGQMCAILGMDAKPLLSFIKDVQGYVTIANYNAHQQLVISGEKEAVDKLSELAKDHGAKRVVPLNTSGAFHSKLMSSAREAFLSFLDQHQIHEPKGQLYLNTTGEAYKDSIKTLMADQLTHSVRFYQMVEAMIEDGIDTFIEIGPKKTLRSLVRRINRNVKVLNIEDEASLERTLKDLEEFHGRL